MPAHDRPKRQSIKALSKAEAAAADAERNKAAEKARRAATTVAATKKRTAKLTVDDLSDRLSKMHIAGRRPRHHRVTRRKARRTKSNRK